MRPKLSPWREFLVLLLGVVAFANNKLEGLFLNCVHSASLIGNP